MKTINKLIITLFVCLTFTPIVGQMNHQKMFETYLTGNLTNWGKELSKIETEKNPTTQTLADAANYTYGYIAWLIDQNKKEEAEHQMARLETLVKQLEHRHYADSCLFYVYRSANAAYTVTLGTGKMAVNGLRAIKFCNRAVEMNANNAIALSLKGNVDFYRPAIFGGNKKEAMKWYKKSVDAFEKQKLTTNNWNYYATMLTLAQAYEKQGYIDEAIATCQKMLKTAPTFQYIAKEYLPTLEKKKKETK
ncbi:MAG: hypothetical protein Q4D14_03465 [Bacteroidales bacterium]|nr:hypothetical protein [Bacteroidales bacterium]